jgi:hypothetical protein
MAEGRRFFRLAMARIADTLSVPLTKLLSE